VFCSDDKITEIVKYLCMTYSFLKMRVDSDISIKANNHKEI